MLGGVGETTATVLVAEVYHRSFETRRHLASFVGLAPSPYNSGDTDRDRGISKAGTKPYFTQATMSRYGSKKEEIPAEAVPTELDEAEATPAAE